MGISENVDTALKLFEIVSIVGGGGLVIFKLGRTTERVEQTLAHQNQILDNQVMELKELKIDIEKVATVLATVAVQNSRLNRLEEDLRELRHGKGWVNPLNDGGK